MPCYTPCTIFLFIQSQPESAQESAPCKYVTFKQFPKFQTNECPTVTSMFLNILTRFSSQFKIYSIVWINVVIFINITVLIAPNPSGSRQFVTSKHKNDFFNQYILTMDLLCFTGLTWCVFHATSNILLCVVCHLLNRAAMQFLLLSLSWLLFLLG